MALQMMMNIKSEELGYIYPDYTLIDALDTAISTLSGEEPEGSRSKAAKRLIDFRDNYQYPEPEELEAMNAAIVALVIG